MADPAQSTETTEKRTELFNKTAAASQKYALKQYADAADLYSEATALQAELNGELDPKNADLLYAYGRCLYHLGVTKSDVLGGQVAGEGSGDKASGKKRKRDADAGEGDASTSGEVAEKVVKKAVESKDGMKVGNDQERAEESSKPFIQITGDTDDWEDDDEEDGEGADGADGEDEEDAENDDDFATAYEILDIARILLVKQAEAIATAGTGKGKAGDEVKHIRERLADTHDLQAEISLENERFADAISDSRASLELKQEIYPTESSIVAEAHFKLSLALEFASVTAPKDADGRVEPGKEGKVDEDMRKDAANHMELAIESSRLRVAEESTKLASLGFEESERKKMEIADVQEMISDMEQRVSTIAFLQPCTGTANM